MKDYYRVWANINLDAISRNVERMRKNVGPDPRLMGIIKADGYGHGAVPIARAIDSMVWGYGVATAQEATNLRENGIEKPVLVLGYSHETCYEEFVHYQIRPTIYTEEMGRLAGEAVERYRMKTGEKASLPVHIKLDTGMSRIGFSCTDESIKAIKHLYRVKGLKLEGCFTHFSKADEKDKHYTEYQYERFSEMIHQLEEEGIHFSLVHCDNSAGIIDLPEYHRDMVRMGISLYGLYPSDQVEQERVPLEPALGLKSHIVYIKTIEPGTAVSYGGTYVADHSVRLATIPVGYGDGYPRNLSNKGYILVHGEKAPICGRVCMDQFMVDVTHISQARMGDKVTLIGREGDACISVEELAKLAGTFNYEFVCDLGKRIPRVYWQQGLIVGKKDYFRDEY